MSCVESKVKIVCKYSYYCFLRKVIVEIKLFIKGIKDKGNFIFILSIRLGKMVIVIN